MNDNTPTPPTDKVTVDKTPQVAPAGPQVTKTPPATPSAKPSVPAAPAGRLQAKPAPLGAITKVPFNIESSVSRGKWLKLLVYGEYGTGKTFLMGTSADIPAMRDVLMINCEAGDLTLMDEAHDFDKIDTIRVRDYGQLGRVQEFLKLHCKLRDEDKIDDLKKLEARLTGKKEEEIETPRKYRTAILDSLSEAEAYCMYQLLGVTIDTKIDEESAAPEWAEYRRNHMMVQRLVRQFRDLEMNVLFTCARSYVQNEAKQFLYSPAMTGKLASQVQGFVDMVGYLTAGAVEGGEANEKVMARRMYVQPVGRFAAKCRFSAYKKTYFDNPDMTDIVTAIGLIPSDKKVAGK